MKIAKKEKKYIFVATPFSNSLLPCYKRQDFSSGKVKMQYILSYIYFFSEIIKFKLNIT